MTGKYRNSIRLERDTRFMLMGKACSLVCAKGTNSSLEYMLQCASLKFSSVFLLPLRTWETFCW